MKRVVIHWTGGTHEASDYERGRYHELVEGDGNRVLGHKPPESNKAPLGSDYVRHTGGLNTDSIGIAVCAMGGKDVKENPLVTGKWPITPSQVKAIVKVAAEYCEIYNIPVTPKTVLTHAEVRGTFGRGVYKWDITYLPGMTKTASPQEIGNRLRSLIQKELDRSKAQKKPEKKLNFFQRLFGRRHR
jgi:hypothetical protein